jgi:hypothetical protein
MKYLLHIETATNPWTGTLSHCPSPRLDRLDEEWLRDYPVRLEENADDGEERLERLDDLIALTVALVTGAEEADLFVDASDDLRE